MFVCQVFVLYVRISLRRAMKMNNASIYTPFTLFSVVEIEILRRKQVLILFTMGLFGAAHRWGGEGGMGGDKKVSRDTLLEFC